MLKTVYCDYESIRPACHKIELGLKSDVPDGTPMTWLASLEPPAIWRYELIVHIVWLTNDGAANYWCALDTQNGSVHALSTDEKYARALAAPREAWEELAQVNPSCNRLLSWMSNEEEPLSYDWINAIARDVAFRASRRWTPEYERKLQGAMQKALKK